VSHVFYPKSNEDGANPKRRMMLQQGTISLAIQNGQQTLKPMTEYQLFQLSDGV
jgi:hypothetical protein